MNITQQSIPLPSSSGVYILKFSEPLGNPNNPHGTAQYYVGWSSNVAARVEHHRAGRGASITKAARQRGIQLEVVVVIPGAPKTEERRIKAQKNTPRFVASYLSRQAVAQ